MKLLNRFLKEKPLLKQAQGDGYMTGGSELLIFTQRRRIIAAAKVRQSPLIFVHTEPGNCSVKTNRCVIHKASWRCSS